jgi:5-methylcytosine-specific restriction endonuclease McrA
MSILTTGDAFGSGENDRYLDSRTDITASSSSGERILVQFKHRGLSKADRDALFHGSRGRCAICGSQTYLQIAHIKAMYLGGSNEPDNFIVLCPVCHSAVDSVVLDDNVLRNIKRTWVDEGVLGAKYFNQFLSAVTKTVQTSWVLSSPSPDPIKENFLQWANALQANRTFDAEIKEARARLKALKNEDEFLKEILWPLFVSLGFERVTVIHHSGAQERGKDMVFCQRDQLGSFTAYAVVACCKKIHTNSSKTVDAGHYAKLLDQVSKCYNNAWHDHHLKRDTFIDKVIIATPFAITDEAMGEFRSWEEAKRRQLIYLYDERLTGMLAELKIQKGKER